MEQEKLLHFSIVIAAKNESENISRLFNSIREIDYPKELFEAIIVDDNSSDNTFKEAEFHLDAQLNISVIKKVSGFLPGKKGALQSGIAASSNPYILITDADCSPQKDWLKSYAQKFTIGYDLLFGAAPFYKCENLISELSCFENLRSTLLSFTAAKLKIPYSAASRNFGFKKSAFEKIKGYLNTMETFSGDDDLLIREAVKNNLRIGIVSGRNSMVYSTAKKTLKEYLTQKRRHTKTSFYYLPKHIVILSSWHLANLFFLISPLLYFINPFFLLFFFAKLTADIFVVINTQHFLSYKFKFYKIFYLQVLYEIFIIINFFNALFFKVKWKEDEHGR
jgi:cellulose synthase/poly-beta-1,6-N-acetylglucosamine synthase-like glycosyltransferase